MARGTSRRRVLSGLVGALGGLAAVGGRGGGAAAQRAEQGTPCVRAGECASFRCVDGYCCDSACTGQCEACNLQGAEGICTPVAGVPVGNRPACSGTDVCQSTCDGVTRTHCAAYPGLDIVCAPTECDHGWLITYGCGGDVTCHPLTATCYPYLCNANGTGCGTSCASDADCAVGASCVGGQCVGEKPLGEPCELDAECQSGICAQGVCCIERCPGGCQACNVPGTEGFCTVIPDGQGCAGGTCCDGECVDTQSNLEHCGTCDNACRLAPQPGTCENEPICDQGACTFTPQPGPDLVLCRDAAGVCDVAEYCDGTAITCPPDGFLGTNVVCRPGGTGINAVCDPPEVCPGTGPSCPPQVFAPQNMPCETGNLCTNDVCNGQGVCTTGSPVPCPNPEQICNPGTGACSCPTNQPLDCGTFCGVECCTSNQCSPTELCNTDGVCVPEGIDLRGVGGEDLYVDDDLTILVNDVVVFTDDDGVETTYPPFNLTLNNGDVIRVQATNVLCCSAIIGPFELYRPSDGATQVLDGEGFEAINEGAGLETGEVFYNETFVVNLPPRT